MSKSLNINDIAKLAGVSRSTVSRVLMNSKNVKPATANIVREAVRKANYRPSILARGLVTGRLNMIAMLMSDPDNPFLMQMVRNLDQEFRDRGYMLGICYLGLNAAARSDNFALIQQYGFAGYIIGDAQNDADFIRVVRGVRQPLILFNRYLDGLSDFDAVVSDNYLGGQLAASHLLELGHTKIGALTGPLDHSSASRDRFQGFSDELRRNGIELEPGGIGEGELSLDSGSDYARHVLGKRGQKCTAVFAGNDLMAIGILNYCREYGIRVPEKLSLIGFDDIALSKSALINLTTVQQPAAAMSSLVAERVVVRCKGEELPAERLLVRPNLVVRGTTAVAQK